MTSASASRSYLLRVLTVLSVLLTAGSAAVAASTTFVFWSHASYGEVGFGEKILDTEGDTAGNVHELITQRAANGSRELAVMRFNLAQTQEFVTGLGYPALTTAKLVVNGTGDSFVAGCELLANGSRTVYLSRIKSTGELLWTQPVASAAVTPNLSLRLDSVGEVVLAVMEGGTASQAQVLRMDADTGSVYWRKVVPGKHSAMATGGKTIFLSDESEITVRLRSLYLPSGAILWDRTFGSPGGGVVRGLEFNKVTGSYVATAEKAGSSESAESALLRFTQSGTLSWTRQGGTGSTNWHILHFGPGGDIFQLVHYLGKTFHLERISDTGTLKYSTPIPEAKTLWAGNTDLLSIDPNGAAYFARREVDAITPDRKARIARVSATGQLDWQLAEGLPYWDTSREVSFIIRGALAPPNSQAPLRLAVEHTENAPDTTFDLRTYFYGPPF